MYTHIFKHISKEGLHRKTNHLHISLLIKQKNQLSSHNIQNTSIIESIQIISSHTNVNIADLQWLPLTWVNCLTDIGIV